MCSVAEAVCRLDPKAKVWEVARRLGCWTQRDVDKKDAGTAGTKRRKRLEFPSGNGAKIEIDLTQGGIRRFATRNATPSRPTRRRRQALELPRRKK